MKLGTIGVVYSMSLIVLLTLTGVWRRRRECGLVLFVFGEWINKYEILGIVLAFAA